MSEGEEKKAHHIAIPPTLQRVLPRSITGAVSLQNKDTADWGWQGFIAFGAQTTIVVVDPITLQCAQTLSKHRGHICQVKWRKTNHYHQLSAPNSLVLASADINGLIYIWDVHQGETIATLQDGNRPILDLEWLGSQDGSEHLLVALHPPYSIILWDTRHSSKVWKKSYTEILLSFQFDPFHLNKMAFLCQGCILLVEDFDTTKSPSSNGNRFYISAPNHSPTRASSSDDKEKSTHTLRKKMRELVSGEVKGRTDESLNSSECLQLLYHHTIHDQLLLLYPREVLILDLVINQTVGVIVIDRSMTNITQIISCWQRDVLYCLHESGSVSCHFRHQLLIASDLKDQSATSRDEAMCEQFLDLIYDRKCQSEPLRLSKSNRPVGLALDPLSEKKMCLVLGDGRVVFKELITTAHMISNGFYQKNDTLPEDKLNIRDDHFSPELTSIPIIKMPVLSLSQIIKPTFEAKRTRKNYITKENGTLRLMMTGLMPSLASPPLVIRMCPPLTTRNLQVYMPLLAVGTQSGIVQVFNLATGVLEREFSLHTYPVRGVEWTSLTSFLSYGNQPLTNSQGKVRNELIHTDTRTGYSITLRGNKTEETPIEMIRVSYLKQYFIVVLKDDPFELWDCQTLTPLRTMPRRFPKISALEWSPTTHLKNRKDSVSSDTKKDGISDVKSSCSKDDLASMSGSLKSSTTSLNDPAEKSIIKENLVFTDTQGQLYRFSVEGNVIKDGNKNPPDPHMNMITCIARKSNDIVLSDSDGNLAIFDLKSRTSKHINTHRGWVKKMRFAPGKDNMKLLVLYADGVDIWDIREIILVAQLKSPKSVVKIMDIDWGASDRPVLATVDGCLRILDIHLKVYVSPITHYYTKDPIVSPYLMTSEAALNLRTVMTHQPWRENYSLLFTTDDGFDSGQLEDINTWLCRIPHDVVEYLKACNSVSHRALIVAYLFGDQGELLFWTVAAFYLSCLASQNMEKFDTSLNEAASSLSRLSVNSPDLYIKEVPKFILDAPQLDASYYHLCDNFVYKSYELERLFLHECKEVSGNLREDLGRRLAVIGERDRVVRLLLDADPSDKEFYTDCLRACLLSATHHSTQAQSTIKLVATNLIAAGNIWEGIELLCIIGKAVDACRYLQSYGHWDNSIWLAKCVLSSSEAGDVIKRWAHHLIATGKKDIGICTYISIGSISSALEQLVQQHYHQRAALLLEACREMNILTELKNVSNSDTMESAMESTKVVSENLAPGDWLTNTLQRLLLSFPASYKKSTMNRVSDVDTNNSPLTSILTSLPENIYRKYILFLFGLTNRPAVHHFCNQLGEIGKEILRELESM